MVSNAPRRGTPLGILHFAQCGRGLAFSRSGEPAESPLRDRASDLHQSYANVIRTEVAMHFTTHGLTLPPW